MEKTRWLNEDEQFAWRGFLLASRLVLEQVHRDLLDESQLSLSEYAILVRLSEEPTRRLRMTELAAASGLSKSRLSHQMTRMEQRGLTQRESAAEDARGMFAVLTDEGYDLLTQASKAHVESVRHHLLDHFTPDQVKELARWTGDVVGAIDVDGRAGPLLPLLHG